MLAFTDSREVALDETRNLSQTGVEGHKFLGADGGLSVDETATFIFRGG